MFWSAAIVLVAGIFVLLAKAQNETGLVIVSSTDGSLNVTAVEDSEDDSSTSICTVVPISSAIDEFPPDLFTQEERASGWVVVHFLLCAYIFYILALVCDDYFVPSIERICEALHLPTDVAGATFMAVATSSPELFTNVIGTFVTKGDIGIGTIVGSAVFNILAVTSICGLAAKTALPLEWYPLTRDFFFYLCSVILLIFFLTNERIYLWEAVALVTAYAIYILVMCYNTSLRKKAESIVGRCRKEKKQRRSSFVEQQLFADGEDDESSPLLSEAGTPGKRRNSQESLERSKSNFDLSAEEMDQLLVAKALEEEEREEEDEWRLLSLPKREGCFTLILWLLSWPARFVLTFTIPDCRRWPSVYMLTLFMCIVWIASLSYLVSWFMTVIGYTFGIPDSVMGLTFLAAGTSVPEAVSSFIVARQGLGTMSLSNSIGSNTFDILVCLGVPWLIRSAILASSSTDYIQINSQGLEYSAMILLASLALLYITLAANKFYLDRKVGIIALVMYVGFVVLSCFLELYVFGGVKNGSVVCK